MRNYVIERTTETTREWWTGGGWSAKECDARWYDREPNAPQQTADENAHAVRYEHGMVEA